MRWIVIAFLTGILALAITNRLSDIGEACEVQPVKHNRASESQERNGGESAKAETHSHIEGVLFSALRSIMVEEMDNANLDSCVVLFHAEVFMADVVLQNQIQTQLFSQNQREMADATKSSGNMHNPKLSFLYTELKPAICKIPAMRELSHVAHSCGYSEDIHILGGEKVQIRRKDLSGGGFSSPDFRIYGITGFSVRKRGLQKKDWLFAKIINVDSIGNIISSREERIRFSQYW